jgi:hypothetical protein
VDFLTLELLRYSGVKKLFVRFSFKMRKAFKSGWGSMYRRKRNRVKMVLAVRVSGVDSQGQKFDMLTHTLDLSLCGVRIGGLSGIALREGSTVLIHRKNRKATFRITWVGAQGTARTGHVGLQSIDAPPEFWGLELPHEGERPVTSSGEPTAEQARIS